MSDFRIIPPEEEEEDVVVGDIIEEDVVQGQTGLLTKEQEQEIMLYLKKEIDEVENSEERYDFFERVKTWRRHRLGRAKEKVKNYPWPKASNICVPMALTETNGIFALLKSNLSMRKPFWQVSTENPKMVDHAGALEELLSSIAESRFHMALRKKNNTILYDLASLGTQFVKIPWTRDEWNFVRKGPDGGLQKVSKVIKNTPDLVSIRLEDMLLRPYWGDDLQRAPWLAHKIHLMKYELEERETKGVFSNVGMVLNGGSNEDIDEGRREQMKNLGLTPPSEKENGLYSIYEVYLFWDVDGDGIAEDLIVWIDPSSGAFLRAEYNDLGIRPFVRIPYFEVPNELYAMGVGAMVENLQEEVDTLHNMRIDGTHISMLQGFVSRKGSGIGPDEQFMPFFHFQVDEPTKDFIPVKFPDLGYGTLQAEMMTKEYADRASSSADAMMGFESRSAGTRATSSGTQFLAQQGSRVFTAISESVEDAYGEIGQIVVFQLIRNKELIRDSLEKLVKPESVPLIEEILNMNVEDIPTTFTFAVKTTDAEKTEDARRQSILTLFQLYTMGGEKLLQLAGMIFSPQAQIPPEMKQAAIKFYIGGVKLLDEIMEFFGEDNSKDFLPYVKNLEYMIRTVEAMQDQRLTMIKGGMNGGQQGGPAGQAGPGQLSQPAGPGMAGGGSQPQGPQGMG